MLTHPTGLFSGNYISAPRGTGPSNFTRHISPINCISSRTWGAGRPHVGLCPIFPVIFYVDVFWFLNFYYKINGKSCWHFKCDMCTVIHYVAALYFHLHLVFIHFTEKNWIFWLRLFFNKRLQNATVNIISLQNTKYLNTVEAVKVVTHVKIG